MLPEDFDVGELGGDFPALLAHRGGPEPAGAVGGAHQRAGHDAEEADLVGFVLQVHEFLRLDPAVHRQVPLGRAQVLGDGDQVAAGVVQVLQGLGDLLAGFAHAQDQVGLGHHAQACGPA